MDEPHHQETTSIFGYGSLMDIESAQRTMPSAANLRFAVLSGFRRHFNLNARIYGTKETAMLSIAATADDSDEVYGVLFDIPTCEACWKFAPCWSPAGTP